MKIDWGFAGFLIIIAVFIVSMIYCAVFLKIDIEYIFLLCLILSLIFAVSDYDYGSNSSKCEFVMSISIFSVIVAVILFIVIFFASGFLLDLMHNIEFNDEIDEVGYHNNTVIVSNFTDFGPDFSKAYWIEGDDGRKYTISESIHDKLIEEYNSSVIGHKLNIFFHINPHKYKRSYSRVYLVDNVTLENGKVIC